jgi:hypothetical protein
VLLGERDGGGGLCVVGADVEGDGAPVAGEVEPEVVYGGAVCGHFGVQWLAFDLGGFAVDDEFSAVVEGELVEVVVDLAENGVLRGGGELDSAEAAFGPVFAVGADDGGDCAA